MRDYEKVKARFDEWFVPVKKRKSPTKRRPAAPKRK
jgi:hypothetical protein